MQRLIFDNSLGIDEQPRKPGLLLVEGLRSFSGHLEIWARYQERWQPLFTVAANTRKDDCICFFEETPDQVRVKAFGTGPVRVYQSDARNIGDLLFGEA